MKKVKLKPWIKELILIIGLITIIFSAIKIGGTRMEQGIDIYKINV